MVAGNLKVVNRNLLLARYSFERFAKSFKRGELQRRWGGKVTIGKIRSKTEVRVKRARGMAGVVRASRALASLVAAKVTLNGTRKNGVCGTQILTRSLSAARPLVRLRVAIVCWRPGKAEPVVITLQGRGGVIDKTEACFVRPSVCVEVLYEPKGIQKALLASVLGFHFVERKIAFKGGVDRTEIFVGQ